MKKILELIKSNNCNSSRCLGCSNLQYGEWKITPIINAITLHHQTPCNLNCIYCRPKGWAMGQYGWWNMHSLPKYSIISALRKMNKRGFLSKNSLLCYGGGEPTVQKDFSEHLKLISDLTFKEVIVYTNAVTFSKELHCMLGLGNGVFKIKTSVDAGCGKTYKIMKGRNAYERVWENLSKYASADATAVTAKYIAISENSSRQDIIGFFDGCLRAGISKVDITPNFQAVWNSQVQDDAIMAAACLYNVGRSLGMEVAMNRHTWGSYKDKLYSYTAKVFDAAS